MMAVYRWIKSLSASLRLSRGGRPAEEPEGLAAKRLYRTAQGFNPGLDGQ
jgi:hypothetical protein